MNALKLAIDLVLPSSLTRKTLLNVPATPWEQPAPASMPYRLFPMNARSATPLISLPIAALVWDDGSPVTIRATLPEVLSIFEMLDVKPPLYGPTGGMTWVQEPTVEVLPPRPPSARYRLPSGPNVSPLGLLRPRANTV